MNRTFSTGLGADRRAVTPVIGTVLVVALTVVLSAAVGSFALGVTDTDQVGGQYAFSTAAGESLSVTVDATSNVEALTVLVDDHAVRTVEGISAGDVLTVTDVPAGATVRFVEARDGSTRVVFEHLARAGFGSASSPADAVVTLSSDAPAVVSPFSCAGADVCIAGDGSGDYTTVSDGIAAAGPGDVVFVAAGTYAPSTIYLSEDLTVVGESGTVFDGSGLLFYVTGDAQLELRDLTIRNYGTGVLIDDADDLTVVDVTVEGSGALGFELSTGTPIPSP